MPYLSEKRIASLKQYLADCRNGHDKPQAWRDHKNRMGTEHDAVADAMARFHIRLAEVRR